jgi:hypothetical protein
VKFLKHSQYTHKTLNYSLWTFLLKICRLNPIHIHAQCVKLRTGISYPLSRAFLLIGSYFGDLLIVTTEKEIAIEMSYADTCSLIYFLLGFHIVIFYVSLWYKKKGTSKHSAICFLLGGIAPSYKSDCLVFRCSFYYLAFFF